ncbi:MAG: hypothetical protein MJZ84_05825 [Paludibacteraceae bacterium]|nr:hypothetical protein [Paludibacteraceae bacterium]
MNTFLKDYAGIILVLLGAASLVVYYFTPTTNLLLVIGLVLQIIGILAFILLNRFVK